MIEINNKNDSEHLIFASEKPTMKEAIEEAISLGVSLEDASIRGEDLSGLHVENGNFSQADFYQSKLCNAVIIKCDFNQANLSDVIFSGAVIRDTDFSFALFLGANLTNCKITGRTNMRGIDTAEMVASQKEVPMLLKALRIEIVVDVIKKPMQKWWGYKHINGHFQVKRELGPLTSGDIEDAMDSPMAEWVHPMPFDARGRDGALRIIEELYNKQHKS